MHKYRLIRKLGEGTFSEVIKAESTKTRQKVAIKCMKSVFNSVEQVNNLREIKALNRLQPHPNIITLIEVLFDEPTGRLALVFEIMEMNMYEAIKGRMNYLSEARVKNYIYQLLKAIEHMHKNAIFHRDIKPENILLSEDTVKLADLGSCRGLYNNPPLTEYISTRWYRAPECLMTDGHYGYKMDIWGVGCVFFEILSLFPLFPGDNELDQINKIHNILGTPPQELLEKFQKNATHMKLEFAPKKFQGIAKLIPHVSQEAQDVILKMLIYKEEDRLTANQLLKLPYFRELREQEMSQFTAGPTGFTRSISKSNLNHVDNLSQYSRRNSDNASDGSVEHKKSIQKKIAGNNNAGRKIDKKKVLPTKKFPELKLMINGEQRTSNNNTLSSDEELQLNFPPIKKTGNNHQHSVMSSSSVTGHHHQSSHHYQGNNGHNNSTYGKGTIKKKQPMHKGNQPGGGMINAHHPSGTIHVTGQHHYAGGHMGSGQSTSVSHGMMSTDFKSTMKHNSSNHSIPSKKMISTIRKPTDLLGAGVTHYGHGGGVGSGHGGAGKKNYMSPYSHKTVTKHNN